MLSNLRPEEWVLDEAKTFAVPPLTPAGNVWIHELIADVRHHRRTGSSARSATNQAVFVEDLRKNVTAFGQLLRATTKLLPVTEGGEDLTVSGRFLRESGDFIAFRNRKKIRHAHRPCHPQAVRT